MTTSLGIGFVLGWIGSMPIAGAVSIFVFQRGLAGRLRDGLLVAAGAGTAEALWCAIVRFGAARVLERWPAVATAAEATGGVILMVLGIYFLRLKNPLPAGDPAPGHIPAVREFRLGFALVAGNISIPVNWLALSTAAYSLGVDTFAGPPAAFAVGVAAGIMGWFTVVLLALDRIRTRFGGRTLPVIMKVMGMLMMATGLVLTVRAWF